MMEMRLLLKIKPNEFIRHLKRAKPNPLHNSHILLKTFFFSKSVHLILHKAKGR